MRGVEGALARSHVCLFCTRLSAAGGRGNFINAINTGGRTTQGFLVPFSLSGELFRVVFSLGRNGWTRVEILGVHWSAEANCSLGVKGD